jgi:hypothetical protein
MSLVLNVEILGEFKNLTAATKGAQTQLQQMNQKAASVSKAITGAFAAIGIGFSLRMITQELEEAAKAAVEDVKSQTLLANQMRNTTNATDAQVKSVEKQINKLQLSASVADDKLRPAYATLLRTTKSTTEAMSLLNLATDVSAGSGKDLTAVTMALSKAYQGKMAALTKLGIPMSDSIQNASDYAKEMTKLNKLQTEAAGTTGKDYTKAMEKIAEQQDKVNRIAAEGVDWQGDLAKAFAGSADAAADTDPYQRMQIIFGEMQEQIGMALLPALNKFSTWLSTPEGQEKFQKIIDGIVGVLTAFGKLAEWAIDNQETVLGIAIALGAITTAVKVLEVTSKVNAAPINANFVKMFGWVALITTAVEGIKWLNENLDFSKFNLNLSGGALNLSGQSTAQPSAGGSNMTFTTPKKTTTPAKSVTVIQNIKATQSAQQIAKTVNKGNFYSGTQLLRGGR